MLFGVSFAGMVSVIASMARMTACSVRVMRSFLVLPAFVVLGCLLMVPRGVCVMLRRLTMMLSCFFRHRLTPGCWLVT